MVVLHVSHELWFSRAAEMPVYVIQPGRCVPGFDTGAPGHHVSFLVTCRSVFSVIIWFSSFRGRVWITFDPRRNMMETKIMTDLVCRNQKSVSTKSSPVFFYSNVISI